MPDQLAAVILIVHVGATWFMTGLIWFVQIVHYPLLGAVPAGAFSEYERAHQRRTTFVVAPLMLVEAGSALSLLWLPGAIVVGAPSPWIGLALLAVIWASTFFVQVPLHGRLESGFDASVWRRLVLTNWIRTTAWSARGIVAALMLN